jgi:hypothetical protein
MHLQANSLRPILSTDKAFVDTNLRCLH